MALSQPTARTERENRVKIVISFASSLASRLEKPQDPALLTDLRTQIRTLPFPAPSTVSPKRDELDKLGTEIWNLSTRLRRDETAKDGRTKQGTTHKMTLVYILRAYAVLLLDWASGHMVKNRDRKSCIRLMKVALKAAKACIHEQDFDSATKVLERAATYQEVLANERQGDDSDEAAIAKRLRLEYFSVRTALAFRQDRLDMAEHFFAKCKQLNTTATSETAEDLADMFYEVGKQASAKRNYEVAVKWFERACDMLGEQDLAMFSPEASELRLCIFQGLVHAYMKLETAEATEKASQMVKLMEADYGDKMAVSLLKIELLASAKHFDEAEYYGVLSRMIRTIVLNDTNLRTLLHHIHKLKNFSNVYACKALDDLLKSRLLRDEHGQWIEKAIITRIWISTSDAHAQNAHEHLQQLFDFLAQEFGFSLSAPATHAAQTLLWKKVEAEMAQDHSHMPETWCRLCLHPLLEKAGLQNKIKIARKMIQCAIVRQDYIAARDAYQRLPEIGRDDPATRYLMYKVGLRGGDPVFAAECLDIVCRSCAKDATLLYACAMEAQSLGDKRQAINVLEKVLDQYNITATASINLPALLRVTLRLLQTELFKDGALDVKLLHQLCTVFEGASDQAKASRRRPSTPEKQLFTSQEFEWFSKTSYNLSLKHCAEIPPQNLARLVTVCIDFIKLLQTQQEEEPTAIADLGLRLAFCEFLAACAYTTMARVEDSQETCLQHYLEVRKHCQAFRDVALDEANKLSGAAQDDILSKQLQVLKLELEAALKLQKWDDLEGLFEQCWSCKTSDRYETLADLILVIHSCLVQAGVDVKYQSKVLGALQKIINLTSRQNGHDVVILSRWLRCLFNLTLPLDEKISLGCLDRVTQIAANKQGRMKRKGTSALTMATPPPSSPAKLEDDEDPADKNSKQHDPYPATELEWIVTSAFNRAIDYYVGEDDANCRLWAEKAIMAAQWLEDGGRLRTLLAEKFATLQLNK